MKRTLIVLLAVALCAAALWYATKCDEAKAPVTLHIIGDSTMADYVENTTRTRGWGEMLQTFFSSEVVVANYARGGRSSHSFYKEGRWQRVIDSLRAGDYVLIQFAHNDEKEGGKDGADGRGTAPWTTYKSYLERYVDESRALGANPVLVTPIIRRYFTADGTISPKGCHDLSTFPDDSTLNYVRVMKRVAREKQVPLVDMTASTKQFVEQLGAEQTIKCIYVPTDGTHTQATGAACYARLAATGLREQGILADYIRTDVQLVLNPTTLQFGTLFVGEEGIACFDLAGLQLTPQEGELVIEAPEGMLIADDPHAVPHEQLTFAYTDGSLWNKCLYLHFTPAEAGSVSEEVTIRYGRQTHRLPVVAEVAAVTERVPLRIRLDQPTLRELEQQPYGIAPVGGGWDAEIDEAQKRYVEVIVPRSEQNRLLRELSFTIEGEVAYRVACAYGKDFYPRTDLGESQQPVEGRRRIVCPMNVLLQAGQQLHIRLFPWSTTKRNELAFELSVWQVEGVVLQ